MFGYVKPYISELKVGEYERYRALYCGLCHSLGHVTGQLSRFTLSYDLVFLALVRIAVTGEEIVFSKRFCPIHPLKKRLTAENSTQLEYAAAVSAVLCREKIRDDIIDEKGIKKLVGLAVSPYFSSISSRAESIAGDECAVMVCDLLKRLAELEKLGCTSLDETADAFGEVLHYLFSLGLDSEISALAGEIGFHTGRFIYICDAADDMCEDIRKDRYNPIASGWGEYALDGGKMSDIVRSSIRSALPIELEALSQAVERLDVSSSFAVSIIKNTVYLGLPSALDKVLTGRKSES